MKLKKLIKEWGVGGVVSVKPIGNPFKKQNGRLDETIPALGKEWKDLDKACYALEKEVLKLAKGAGKIDKKHAKDILGLWKYTSNNIKKFKDLLSKEILSKLQ